MPDVPDEKYCEDCGKTIGEGEEAALCDFIADDKVTDPLDEICGMESVMQLQKSLGMLDEGEWLVVNRRYGLDGNKPLSLSQIGIQMGYSKETIRKIESAALKELKNNIANAGGYSELVA